VPAGHQDFHQKFADQMIGGSNSRQIVDKIVAGFYTEMTQTFVSNKQLTIAWQGTFMA
jgi:hypothetical protein